MEKGVIEVGITGIEFVGVDPGDQGPVRILFTTDRHEELAIILPLPMLSLLEAKLEAVREHMAGKQPLQ
jgi:hypothetical protein